MAKIFRSREYGSFQKLLSAVEAWISLNDEYKDSDFFIVIRKPQEWEK